MRTYIVTRTASTDFVGLVKAASATLAIAAARKQYSIPGYVALSAKSA